MNLLSSVRFAGIAFAVFGVVSLKYRRRFGHIRTRSSYTKCLHCLNPLTRIQKRIREDGFCSRGCKRKDRIEIQRLAVKRLQEYRPWTNQTGSALVDEALLIGAAVVIGGSVLADFYRFMMLVWSALVNYATCTTPGGCW